MQTTQNQHSNIKLESQQPYCIGIITSIIKLLDKRGVCVCGGGGGGRLNRFTVHSESYLIIYIAKHLKGNPLYNETYNIY